MPVKEDREYRKLAQFEARKREEGNEEQIVEGYATVFNEPYELYRDKDYTFSEQVDARAFDETDMRDVIMQYDHAGRVFARNGNGTLELTPDEHGLKVVAHLGGTEIGRELYEEIAGGYTTKMSFGFTVAEDEITEQRDGETVRVLRTIKRIKKLYDVSAVSIPANDATEISARNLGEGVIAGIREERIAEQARARQIAKIKLMLEV